MRPRATGRGALATLARRPLDPVYGPSYLAGYLYDEGRLALLEGDGPRALRAWRHLLALRDDPDPPLRPQVAARPPRRGQPRRGTSRRARRG